MIKLQNSFILLTNVIWCPKPFNDILETFFIFHSKNTRELSRFSLFCNIFFYYYICLPFCRDFYFKTYPLLTIFVILKNYTLTRKWMNSLFPPYLSSHPSISLSSLSPSTSLSVLSIDWFAKFSGKLNLISSDAWLSLWSVALTKTSFRVARGIHKVTFCCCCGSRWGNNSLVDQRCYTWVARDTPFDSIRFRLACLIVRLRM